MELFKEDIDWATILQPLINKYKNTPHPLQYKSLYQLIVMVVLSAQDSDANINIVAPKLFKKYPDMKALSTATTAQLTTLLSGVRYYNNKISWLQNIANTVKEDNNIPLTMKGLTALKGIGRKSANTIRHEFNREAVGILVDLHVLDRVTPRLGVAIGKNAEKIEKQLMAKLPQNQWGSIGMAISHLGRETCRPSNPKHDECILRKNCDYYQKNNK